MTERSYADLRDFIDRVEALGALRRIEGADPVCEIGGITEIAAGLPECPALLFDAIKGHARGFRVFTNATVSPQRAALALGIDPALRPIDALKEWKSRRAALTMHKPVTAERALFLENSRSGADVDLALFPAPLWHHDDGGNVKVVRLARSQLHDDIAVRLCAHRHQTRLRQNAIGLPGTPRKPHSQACLLVIMYGDGVALAKVTVGRRADPGSLRSV